MNQSFSDVTEVGICCIKSPLNPEHEIRLSLDSEVNLERKFVFTSVSPRVRLILMDLRVIGSLIFSVARISIPVSSNFVIVGRAFRN